MRDALLGDPAAAPLTAGPAAAPVLETSRRSLLCEHHRVPYRVAAADGAGATLRWRRRDGSAHVMRHPVFESEPVAEAGEFRVWGGPIFGRVLPDAVAGERLAGGGWAPAEPVEDAAGRRVASIWRHEAGDAFLPFDPDEVIRNFRSEAYEALGGHAAAARARAAARKLYYRVRPVLPRRAQIALRRAFKPVQARATFPRWPVEPALHDFEARMLALHAELAGEPIPYIAPWPSGCSWALVLTHDVETAVGLEHVHLLRDLELASGYRSSWNLVPERYRVDDAVVRDLAAEGFEIGVHGLRHDGRDIDSPRRLRRRLPAMRAAAERWGAIGFRAPALHRSWTSMPRMGFEYDSSYPDSDPYEPQPGGCCSWLPFFNEDLVELPVTLPQDHTIFTLLGESDERLWVEKADAVAAAGGMALIITHPDYMLDEGPRGAYERFLKAYAADAGVWRALPREVSDWWRRRAASRIEPAGRGWQVAGPAAAEATIAYAGGER